MSDSGSTTSEASRPTDTARRAPATQPHTRLSAALGVAAATAGLGLLVAIRFDDDHRVGERLISVAVLGALLGLGYVATRLRPPRLLEDESYWAGYAKCARDLLGERSPRATATSAPRHRTSARR